MRVDERSWKDENGKNVCGGVETNVFENEIKCQKDLPTKKHVYTNC